MARWSPRKPRLKPLPLPKPFKLPKPGSLKPSKPILGAPELPFAESLVSVAARKGNLQ
jgi:hypothetical protein